MSALVLQLEGHVQYVRTTVISDDQEVFSILDFMKLVCKGKSDNYAGRLWPSLKNKPELEGLVVDVPLQIKCQKSPYKQPVVTHLGPATTRVGLQKLLLVLGDKVKDEFRQVDDSALNRFMTGDMSGLTEFDFISTVPRKERKAGVTQIHYNHYNFMPPVHTPSN